MINKLQVSEKINALSINSISEETNFSLRQGAKINGKNLMTSFFMMMSKGENTLQSWATEFSILTGESMSAKGIEKALIERRETFAKRILEDAIEHQLSGQVQNEVALSNLDHFNSIYLEDSSCFSLPSILHEYFKGPNSPTGSNVATAKIQLRQDLKTGKYTRVILQGYRDNDQKFSSDILTQLLENDLVLRDLGYSVLNVFRQITEKGAYFISLLKSGIHIFDPITKKRIHPIKLLRRANRKREKVIELDVLVGAKEKLPVRFVALKASNKVAKQRRESAKNDRHSKANHSKEYLELLGWTLLITNVKQEVLNARALVKVYGYRWRIEIIFKAWKSGIGFDKLFNKKRSVKKERVVISFYFMLVWLTLFFTNWYQYFLNEVYRKFKKFISVLKFAKFAKKNFEQLATSNNLAPWIQAVKIRCVYDSRKKYKNACEKMYT